MTSILRTLELMNYATQVAQEHLPGAEIAILDATDPSTWIVRVEGPYDPASMAAAVQAVAAIDVSSPLAGDVHREALRRQMAVYGVDSHQALTDARTDDAEQSTRIILQVTDPAAVAEALRSIWSRQDAFRRFETAAARLKALPRIPDDYRSDQHWS